MAITERQELRRSKAIKMHLKHLSENPSPRWIGEHWNTWREQALVRGSTPKQALEAADKVMFDIPETDEETGS